jgi:RNA polymerase sigma factor (sigma-70 family)
MPRPLPNLLARLRRVARPREATDGDALTRFARTQDPDAFAHLVTRFGPMVMAVCRRTLGDTPDADDAYQATFLVLVRKARTVKPPEAVGSWLFAVAHRTAVYARTVMLRRAAKLRPLTTDPATDSPVSSDLMTALDAELANLPDKFRDAVVLCELDGKSLKEAADAVGVPVGTMASRLARGRQMLAERLRARGYAITATAVSGLLASAAVATAPEFNPTAPAAGSTPLADGVMKMALLSKLKLTTAVGLCVLAAGVFGLGVLPVPMPTPVAHAAPVPKDDGKLTEEKKKELDALFANLGRSGPEGTRATLTFAGQPATAVAYLKQRLRPLKLTEEEAKGLIAKLFSDKDDEYKAAKKELADLDPRLAMPVVQVWALAETEEQKLRLAQFFVGEREEFPHCTIDLRIPEEDDYPAQITVKGKPGVPANVFPKGRVPNYTMGTARDMAYLKKWGHWESHSSAITVLEHIGTPEAVKVIEDMATGHPDAAPTIVAKQVLERRKKK